MSKQYIVWINESGQGWEPNGDGPLGPKTAERIAQEIRRYCFGCKTKVLPVGEDPTTYIVPKRECAAPSQPKNPR